MTIHLGSGGPVELYVTITGTFQWSVTAKLSDGVTTQKVSKKHLTHNAATLLLSPNANSVKGHDLDVVVSLYNPTNSSATTNVTAVVQVNGSSLAPAVINATNVKVNNIRHVGGNEDLA